MVAKRSRGRSQAERSAESSRRLLDAAVALIAEKGFGRTTAAEIGERAGFSREMVRARYGSKEALLESLMRDEFEPMFLGSGTGSSETALGRLLDLWDHLARESKEQPELLRALFVVCFETVGAIQGLSGWVREWIAYQRGAVAEALRAGQADGSIRLDLDPDREADRIVTYGLGLGFRWTLEPEAVDFSVELRSWGERLRESLRAHTGPAG
ncbi:TetR/AcrR family transcriptional regulator [Pseudonocardia acidicola]|uniref:TetR/AcrR family transcriptional regulator n=1 Tax=Pseudonocardia acidicola TaxID=2724939 RepID=A0ABX1SBR6_9PSEU|nr:TetR/AcrR family transcriptional regulator [Pseudonocardia acidicola]NMH98257.1 TetR/AcrR family transcriptional regulator [Pseudonocardia acidicola]